MLESSRKKLWQACGKWSHDRYQVDYQRPKTARELIGLYGYDIRTSDKPPKLPPVSLGRGRYFQSPFFGCLLIISGIVISILNALCTVLRVD